MCSFSDLGVRTGGVEKECEFDWKEKVQGKFSLSHLTTSTALTEFTRFCRNLKSSSCKPRWTFHQRLKNRRVLIQIIESPSAASSATSSTVPVYNPSKPPESPVVELSFRAVRPTSSNTWADMLEPVSSHSLKLPATDASSGNSKVSLTARTDLTDNDKKIAWE